MAPTCQDSESPKWDWQGLGEFENSDSQVFACQTNSGNPHQSAQMLNGRVGEVNRYIHDVSRPKIWPMLALPKSLLQVRLFSIFECCLIDWWILRVDWRSLLHFYKGTKCLWMAYQSPSRLRTCNLPGVKSVKLWCVFHARLFLQHLCKHLVSFRMFMWEDSFIFFHLWVFLRQAVWSNGSETSSRKKMQKGANRTVTFGRLGLRAYAHTITYKYH